MPEPTAHCSAVSPVRRDIHGADGLGGVVLPAGGSAAPGLAADIIRDILRHAAEPVTLVGIGPATNLALGADHRTRAGRQGRSRSC